MLHCLATSLLNDRLLWNKPLRCWSTARCGTIFYVAANCLICVRQDTLVVIISLIDYHAGQLVGIIAWPCQQCVSFKRLSMPIITKNIKTHPDSYCLIVLKFALCITVVKVSMFHPLLSESSNYWDQFGQWTLGARHCQMDYFAYAYCGNGNLYFCPVT